MIFVKTRIMALLLGGDLRRKAREKKKDEMGGRKASRVAECKKIL